MTKVGKVLLIVGVSIGVLALVGVAMWRGVGDGGIGAEKARAKSLGLPLEPNGNLPRPDPGDNAGPDLAKLGRDLNLWASPQDGKRFSSEDTRDADLVALQPYVRRALEFTKKPECAFGYDFNQGFNVLFPELADTRSIGKLLIGDAIRLAKLGRVEEAFDRLDASARLGTLLGKSEPTLIASLVQMSQNAMTLTALQRVITIVGPTPQALKRAEGTVSALGPLPSIKRSLQGEWALALYVERIPPEELRQALAMGEVEESPVASDFALGASLQVPSMRRRMVAHYLRSFLDYYASMPTDPEDLAGAEVASTAMDARMAADTGWEAKLTQTLTPVFSHVHVAVGRDLAQRRAVRNLIVALRTDARALPNLGADSEDPFSGAELVFRRKGREFTVYSVGSNKVDDGGDSNRVADIVARYPYVERKRPPSPATGPGPSPGPGGPPGSFTP